MSSETREIVGNVQQVPSWGRYRPLGAVPTVYLPASQVSDGFLTFAHTWFSPRWVVRTARAPRDVLGEMERAVRSIDAYLPFASFETMREQQAHSWAPQRVQAVLLSTLAGLALLLVAVGVYGLAATAVTERRREAGIRMALGATVTAVVRSVVMPGLWLALALARVAGLLIAILVWGVSPTDPWTFAAAGALLLAVAAVASLLPALRLARRNPIDTLRE